MFLQMGLTVFKIFLKSINHNKDNSKKTGSFLMCRTNTCLCFEWFLPYLCPLNVNACAYVNSNHFNSPKRSFKARPGN
jgi:hypothetical protein